MKKLLLLPLVLLFFFSSNAMADQTATFTAIAPTLYENGSSIGTDDTLSYFIYCGTDTGVYSIAFNMTDAFVAGGENIDVSLCVPSPGTYYFVATAYSFLHQAESVYSNQVIKTFTTEDFVQIPMAPTVLSVAP